MVLQSLGELLGLGGLAIRNSDADGLDREGRHGGEQVDNRYDATIGR